MNRSILFIIVTAAMWLASCASMHDKKGWDHTGDPKTHQDNQPYLLEHRH
ncbi:MAG: hypothetical protein R8M38_07735 [Mariprofundaceae bacterium]